LLIGIISEMVQGVENANNDAELLMQIEAGNGALMKGGGRKLVLCNPQHIGRLIDTMKFEFAGESSHDATGAAPKFEEGFCGRVVASDGAGDDIDDIAAVTHDGVVEGSKLIVVRHASIIALRPC
jgi:hypothetical protein